MFLFALPPQDEIPFSSFADVKHAWHHDVLAFIHRRSSQSFVFILALCLSSWCASFSSLFTACASSADRQAASNPQRANELRTIAAVLRATALGIVGFIVLIHTLAVFGVPTTSLLASAGLVGVGIGLGAQSLFKDLINGVFILVENQYNVGDNVKIAGLSGTVEDLTLRLTTLRDGDGTLYLIPNSQIATVSNMSRGFAVANLAIVVDALADPDRVLALLRSTALSVRNDEAFKNIALADPDIPGIDSISGRAVTYPISIRVRINQKDAILRELRRRILQTFEENNIPPSAPTPPTCS